MQFLKLHITCDNRKFPVLDPIVCYKRIIQSEYPAWRFRNALSVVIFLVRLRKTSPTSAERKVVDFEEECVEGAFVSAPERCGIVIWVIVIIRRSEKGRILLVFTLYAS